MKTLISFLSNILTKDKNVSSGHPSDKTSVRSKKNEMVKYCSSQVIETISALKTDDEKTSKSTDLDIKMSDDRWKSNQLYIQFKNMVIKKSKGDNLPPSKYIESTLKISERKRKEFRNQGVKEGYIIKTNIGDKIIYKYNINYQ